ncbi:hypothetical protein [Burkholderia sp. ABCPW 14]|uniref:hypothetical protein n=1 Tax=Burkholderia sp. ABCPW 14 TaxID=1637860 RepID=UPI000A570D20|nr:hypothetical protein [Burkholderia sp. ABCPW 14]
MDRAASRRTSQRALLVEMFADARRGRAKKCGVLIAVRRRRDIANVRGGNEATKQRSIRASEHQSIEASNHRSIESSKQRSIEAKKQRSGKKRKPNAATRRFNVVESPPTPRNRRRAPTSRTAPIPKRRH